MLEINQSFVSNWILNLLQSCFDVPFFSLVPDDNDDNFWNELENSESDNEGNLDISNTRQDFTKEFQTFFNFSLLRWKSRHFRWRGRAENSDERSCITFQRLWEAVSGLKTQQKIFSKSKKFPVESSSGWEKGQNSFDIKLLFSSEKIFQSYEKLSCLLQKEVKLEFPTKLNSVTFPDASSWAAQLVSLELCCNLAFSPFSLFSVNSHSRLRQKKMEKLRRKIAILGNKQKISNLLSCDVKDWKSNSLAW